MLRREIGVFDSGVGGLTVLKELVKKFPNDSFVYVGDTEHVPYGKKSGETVKGYTKLALDYFESRVVKAAVIACNTATAASLPELAEEYDFPVIGVIEPACHEIVRTTKNKKVLLLATEGTVKSGVYDRRLKDLDPDIRLESVAAPHLVTAVEDGMGDHYIGAKIAMDYIRRAKYQDYDTLVLACTHFPVVQPKLEDYFRRLRKEIMIIDPSAAVAQRAASLIKPDWRNKDLKIRYYVTGDRRKFAETAKKITGEEQIFPRSLALPDDNWI